VKLAAELRAANIAVELGYKGNAGKRMKRADKLGCRFAVIFGGDELAKGVVKLKDLKAGSEAEVPRNDLASRLK
jgi:histidyl-tRNA synthetase